MANFDVELNDEVENFTVEFGEVQRITVDDFDKLRNRPSYAGQTMTHETNIPEVPTAVSQLTNDEDYQTGSEVESAISTAVGDEKDAREQADDGLSRDIGVVDGKVDAEAGARERADTALQGAIDDEETARKNADNGLQGQIDAITSSSDVVDIVGTYAELLQYPTAGLGDKDVIKVLQDETHNDAMSYYRWNKSSSTWSYIGSEGPYYTKSETNTLLGDKQDTLTAGTNITISPNNTISATDTTYTAGNGLTLTGTEFSADTTVLQPKLTAGDGINISPQNVISADIDPADFFTASETVDGTGSEMTLNNTIQAKIKSVQMDGDTTQQTYTGKNLINVPSSYTGSGWRTITSLFPTIELDTYYTLSCDEAIGGENGVYIRFDGGNDGVNLSANKKRTFRFTHEVINIYLYSNGYSAGASSGIAFSVKNMMFEKNSTATSYEPYVGRITAPNPDYPQDVNVVTGEQTIKTNGKNLLTGDYAAGTHLGVEHSWDNVFVKVYGTTTASYTDLVTSSIGSILPPGTYTFSISKPISQFRVNFRVQYGGSNHDAVIMPGDTYATLAIPDNVNDAIIQRPFISGMATGTFVSDTFGLMLEECSTATPFQRYYTQSHTIDLGSTELCKIGNHQDYIYKSGDDWYVHKETARVDVSSLGGWFASGSYAYKTRNGMSDILPASSDSATAVGLCNAFSVSTTNLVYAGSVDYGFALPGAGGTGILIRNKNVASLADFTTYLSNNPVYGYFALVTPTDTKITDATLISELDALADALGYKDKTIIMVSATGTNLPAILEVSAYRNSLAGVLGVIGRAEAA